MKMRIAAPLFLLLSWTLTACSKPADQTPASAAPPAASEPTAAPAASGSEIRDAIASTDRLADDRDEDSWRRPEAVLEFLGVKPGMRVVDYFAGGGYYTELLARIVGPQGQVIAFNNAPYQKYAGDKPAQRYGSDRLPNVVQLTGTPEDAAFEPDSLDAALFVQSYHDLYWRAKDGSWPQTDPKKALAALVPALKSGAAVVVLDHVGKPGVDPLLDVDVTHRIDPAVVKRDFEAAGLTFEAESPVFANPEDDHTKPVFDEAIRHKTDQFMYRFRKP